MFTISKVFGAALLSVAVLVGSIQSVKAQPPEKADAVIAALEMQLVMLKRMTAEVEEKLKTVRAAAKKGDFKPGPGGPGAGPGGPFGPAGKGFGPGGWYGPMGDKERAEMKERMMKKFAPNQPKGETPPSKTQGAPNREIMERLEKLTREIEEIRRSLRK